MNLYEKYCVPYLTDCMCGVGVIHKQRSFVVPKAKGKVLEIGMGSGLNLSHYDAEKVDFIWGLEPSEGMRKRAAPRIAESPLDIKWLGLPSEEIPLDDNSADTVLLTYTLCSIAGWQQALSEMHRVLKPEGKLLFCEHGLAPDGNVQKWQHRLNPLWRKFTAGCNLTRDVPECLETGGFEIEELETGFIKGPRFATYNYWGSAKICS